MALVAWYPLIKDGTNICGNNLNLPSTSSFVEGKFGKCIQFPESTHTERFDNNKLSNKKSVSFAFWLRVDKAVTENYTDILSFYTNSSNGGKQISRIETSETTNLTFFDPSINPNNNGCFGFPIIRPFSVGVWYHIALVIDMENKIVITYCNGNEFYNRSSGLDDTWTCDGTGFMLGEACGISLNDVRFYNHALSPKEVQIISQACVLNYDFNDPYIESTENLVTALTVGQQTNWNNNILTNTGVQSDTYFFLRLSRNLTLNKTYTLSFDAECDQLKKWVFAIGNFTDFKFNIKNGHNEYTFVCVQKIIDEINNRGNALLIDDQGNPGTIFKFYNFQIEEKDHATPYANGARNGLCYDSSGYSNNAINTGISMSNESIMGQLSAQFIGNCSKYLVCKNFMQIPQNITYSCWVKQKSDSPAGQQFIMSQGRDCTSFGFNILSNGGGVISYIGTSSNKTAYLDGNFSLLDDKWHMITAVYNGTNAYLYIDGLEKKSIAITGDIDYSESYNVLTIGKMAYGYTNGDTYFPFNGLISDAKIYATALSAEDIKDLYESKAYITNNQKLIVNEIIEQKENLAFLATKDIQLKKMGTDIPAIPSTYETFVSANNGGLYSYEQANNKTYLTDKGIHIVRPANYDGTSSGGQDDWGGFKWCPMNISKDILKKNHTYIITWNLSGQSSNVLDCYWTNNMGWSGGGLDPTPTNIEWNIPGSNFQGEQLCYYIFAINDDIWKKCTASYSAFQKDQYYLSYRHLAFGFGYTHTGTLGTDLYITNLQMFDITDLVDTEPNISSKSILSAIGISEETDTSIYKSGLVTSNEFLEI